MSKHIQEPPKCVGPSSNNQPLENKPMSVLAHLSPKAKEHLAKFLATRNASQKITEVFIVVEVPRGFSIQSGMPVDNMFFISTEEAENYMKEKDLSEASYGVQAMTISY